MRRRIHVCQMRRRIHVSAPRARHSQKSEEIYEKGNNCRVNVFWLLLFSMCVCVCVCVCVYGVCVCVCARAHVCVYIYMIPTRLYTDFCTESYGTPVAVSAPLWCLPRLGHSKECSLCVCNKHPFTPLTPDFCGILPWEVPACQSLNDRYCFLQHLCVFEEEDTPACQSLWGGGYTCLSVSEWPLLLLAAPVCVYVWGLGSLSVAAKL